MLGVRYRLQSDKSLQLVLQVCQAGVELKWKVQPKTNGHKRKEPPMQYSVHNCKSGKRKAQFQPTMLTNAAARNKRRNGGNM